MVTVGVHPVEFDFDQADFDHLIETIRSTLEHLTDTLAPSLRPLLDLYFRLWAAVPPWVVEAAYRLIDWAIELIEDLTNLIIRLLEGIGFPGYAVVLSLRWREQARSLDEVGTALRDTADQLGVTWQGEGQRAFALHAAKQYEKIQTMSAFATTASGQLAAGAVVGVSFYTSLAMIIAQTTSEVTAAAASTAIDGPGGPAAAGVSASLGALEILAAVAAVEIPLGYMAQGWLSFIDSADAMAAAWPDPSVNTYADGSASDGDRTDWSTER